MLSSSRTIFSCRADPEGWGPVSQIRPFDLTSCFEEGAVFSPLLAAFLAVAILACWRHRRNEIRKRSKKSVWVLRAKLVRMRPCLRYLRLYTNSRGDWQACLSLAFIASCANLILILAARRRVAFLPSYALEIGALLAAPFLSWQNHYRTRTSSSLLLLFWPVYAAAVIVWSRTALTISPNGSHPVVFGKGVVAFCGLAAFALECLGPEFTPEDGPGQFVKGHVESPLLTANIFSKWSFGWMNKLMKKGATEYITENDLPGLVPSDEASALGNRLMGAMERQYVFTLPIRLGP